MQKAVAERMIVSSAQESFSDFIELAGANGVRADVEATSIPAGAGLRLQFQVVNDLENWKSTGAATQILSVGYVTAQLAGIAARFVRVRVFFSSGSGLAALSIGLTTKHL